MGKDRYQFYLCSEDSENLQPQNKVTDFIVELPEPLDLPGIWEVGLYQADYRLSRQSGNIYLCCDLCEESLIHGRQLPILQKLEPRGGYFNPIPLFVDVKADFIRRIHLCLLDTELKPMPVESGKFECTLILRRQRCL